MMKNDDFKRASFDNQLPEERLTKNAGIKLKNKEVLESQDIKKKFEEAVDQYQQNSNENISKAIELGQKFISLLNDKTLSANAGPMQKSLEKELLKEWQSYILEMNNPPESDLTTPNGMGSLSGILLLFSCIIRLRDRANNLDFKIHLLEKEINQLKTRLKEEHVED